MSLAALGLDSSVVVSNFNEFRQWHRTPGGKRAIRYTLGSGFSFVISQVVFLASYGVFHFFGARGSSILATVAGAVPSYFMNRYWAWEKRGKSHLSKEVIPYFAMAGVSLAFSTWSADFASSHRSFIGSSHFAQLLLVDGAYMASFAILWFGKYSIMNRLLFARSKSPRDEVSIR